MTKQQWLHRVMLAAGTIVLASACEGPKGECETNDVTGEVFCNAGAATDPTGPATIITPEPDHQ